MKKTIVILTFLFVFSLSNNANEREIVLGQGHYGNGHDQIYIEPPYVTYDDDLNELYVYFGTTGTIDLEYVKVTMVDTLPLTPTCLWVTIRLLSIVFMDTHIMETSLSPKLVREKNK